MPVFVVGIFYKASRIYYFCSEGVLWGNVSDEDDWQDALWFKYGAWHNTWALINIDNAPEYKPPLWTDLAKHVSCRHHPIQPDGRCSGTSLPLSSGSCSFGRSTSLRALGKFNLRVLLLSHLSFRLILESCKAFRSRTGQIACVVLVKCPDSLSRWDPTPTKLLTIATFTCCTTLMLSFLPWRQCETARSRDRTSRIVCLPSTLIAIVSKAVIRLTGRTALFAHCLSTSS